MQKKFWRTYKMLTLTKSSCFTILFFLSKLIGTRETGNPSAQSKTETLLPKVQTGNPQYTFVWFSSRGLTVFGSQRIDFIQSKPVLDFQPLANQLFSFTCNFKKNCVAQRTLVSVTPLKHLLYVYKTMFGVKYATHIPWEQKPPTGIFVRFTVCPVCPGTYISCVSVLNIQIYWEFLSER